MNKEYKQLAYAILFQAMKDYRKKEYKKEIDEFIKTEWCLMICDTIELDYNTYLQFFKEFDMY